tara:strand:+ start:324 stop:1223 length:900 start_codon:yes stop_codon:yes gene_type:complete
MKVFDCTTFYNENMMLEVRFNILNPFVDKFVISESRFSHSGEKKKLNFDINQFKEFKNKIIYLVVDNEPENLVYEDIKASKKEPKNQIRENAIKRIAHQRDFLINGLSDANNDDYIFYSDNDEIPKFENIDLQNNNKTIVAFQQKLFYYKFNLFCDRMDWHGTRGCKKKDLKSFTWLRNIKIKKYSKLRLDTLFSDTKYSSLKIVIDGGWHFSQLKSPEDIQIKLTNSEDHYEYKLANKKLVDIEDLVKRKVIIYDHQAKSSEYKFGKEFKLKTISMKEMPSFLQNKVEKYSSWFDLDE